jgi:hypothetical protein
MRSTCSTKPIRHAQPITLELAVVPGEHIGKLIAYAFPLVALGRIADDALGDVGMLHRQGDGFVVAFGELGS